MNHPNSMYNLSDCEKFPSNGRKTGVYYLVTTKYRMYTIPLA